MRTALVALAALALTTAGPVGLTQAGSVDRHEVDRHEVDRHEVDRHEVDRHGPHRSTATKVFTLDPSRPGNNPEGVAWDPRSESFFVGTVGTGTIYRGTLRDATVHPFITPDPADPADSAVGMKVAGDRLYVAGGSTGSIYVYKVRTGALLARFETGPGGFLNDLVVTRRGDVYVTDSFRPRIWHLSPAMVKAAGGTPQSISVAPEIDYAAGQFNLNGIVSRHGGRELVVVSTFSRSLFRIAIDPENVTARTITRIDAPPLAGDGLLVDHGQLLVVTGDPARVTVLKLTRQDSRARVVRVLTDPLLRGPSTIARADHRYLVVNADFAANAQPYTVVGLPRG